MINVMPAYATLDAIADSYNPLLLVFSLICIGMPHLKAQWKMGGLRLIGFSAVILVAYGLMFADKRYAIWGGFGLDYSTHTATSIGMVLFLSYCTPRLAMYLSASFILYALLMLYQQYHSLLDILTTGLIVAPLLGGVLMALHRVQGQLSKSRVDTSEQPGR